MERIYNKMMEGLIDALAVTILFIIASTPLTLIVLSRLAYEHYGGGGWWLFAVVGALLALPPIIEALNRLGRVGVVVGISFIIMMLAVWWVRGSWGWVYLCIITGMAAIVSTVGWVRRIEEEYG